MLKSYSGVHRSFEWSNADDLFDPKHVHDAFLTRSVGGLARFLAELYYGPTADTLISAISSLRADRFKSLVGSPQVCNILVDQGRGLPFSIDRFLEQAVFAELAHDNIHLGSCGSSATVWSALGDFCLQWDSDSNFWLVKYKAPCVGSSVTYDAVSPYTMSSTHGINGWASPTPYDSQRAVSTGGQVGRAFEYLAEASEHAFRFVCDTASVICARINNATDAKFVSASSRAYIGRIELINVHHKEVSDDVLVNALIHESVHSFIYKLELWLPLTCRADDGWRIKIVSPWTGRDLRLATYVHACYVYYSLLQFWLQPETARVFSQAIRFQNLQVLASGFRRNLPQLMDLRSSSVRLGEGVWDDLLTSTEKALDAIFCSRRE